MLQELCALQSQPQVMRHSQSRPADFCRIARAHTKLLTGLPPRYADVLHQLLDRLESSALFAEESCSFSQQGLLDSLQLWLDKADRQLTSD